LKNIPEPTSKFNLTIIIKFFYFLFSQLITTFIKTLFSFLNRPPPETMGSTRRRGISFFLFFSFHHHLKPSWDRHGVSFFFFLFFPPPPETTSWVGTAWEIFFGRGFPPPPKTQLGSARREFFFFSFLSTTTTTSREPRLATFSGEIHTAFFRSGPTEASHHQGETHGVALFSDLSRPGPATTTPRSTNHGGGASDLHGGFWLLRFGGFGC
jgi:hypothetical protein